ncbi:translation initiation factor IF-2 subunit gamma [Candidatus Woesearchaeota archaeon]|nr:translation initiation factor IF-2 subunit gamma [Candidatus Woesearchaeota archaeon]
MPIQPEINIGMVGHVDHGKTTLVSKLSGKWTDTHSEEIKRGITIRLGYADITIYKCKKCKEPEAYITSEKCPKCGSTAEQIRKISLVDAPGHETLMATMLSGAAIMDAALLLVAANEECPQPQTKEHLMALEISCINNIIIVQNKIDLVSEENALKNYEQIKEFVKGTIAENVPIIPISAQHGINIDVLLQTIQEKFITPERDMTKDPIMFIARSFDINKPGIEINKLVGGVLGGALKQGILKVGDKIEIRPGIKVEKEGKIIWNPLLTEISSLKTGNSSVDEVYPGGSIGVLTKLDPSLVKADSLTGNMLGHPEKLPKVWNEINLEPHLLNRVVGSKDELIVEPVKKGEPLMLNVNSATTVGIVSSLGKNIIHVVLKLPICADIKDRVTISRRIGSRFRLIGYCNIRE